MCAKRHTVAYCERGTCQLQAALLFTSSLITAHHAGSHVPLFCTSHPCQLPAMSACLSVSCCLSAFAMPFGIQHYPSLLCTSCFQSVYLVPPAFLKKWNEIRGEPIRYPKVSGLYIHTVYWSCREGVNADV